MVTTLSLLEEEEEEEDGVDGQAMLGHLDAWYAYYHRHWWCRRRQFTRFKQAHLWWNGLALLLMASGLIVGPVLKNSWVVAGLAAVSTLVKGWIDFRNWGTLVQLSQFAYTTYAKTLIELRTWVRSGDDGDPAAFLVKMQTLDDMVTDFVPPLTDTYWRVYEARYLYCPCPSIKVNETGAEPTIPGCLPADDVNRAPKDAPAENNDHDNKAVSSPS